jgi:hypothetical protein
MNINLVEELNFIETCSLYILDMNELPLLKVNSDVFMNSFKLLQETRFSNTIEVTLIKQKELLSGNLMIVTRNV